MRTINFEMTDDGRCVGMIPDLVLFRLPSGALISGGELMEDRKKRKELAAELDKLKARYDELGKIARSRIETIDRQADEIRKLRVQTAGEQRSGLRQELEAAREIIRALEQKNAVLDCQLRDQTSTSEARAARVASLEADLKKSACQTLLAIAEKHASERDLAQEKARNGELHKSLQQAEQDRSTANASIRDLELNLVSGLVSCTPKSLLTASTPDRESLLELIRAERLEQEKKWGQSRNSPFFWIALLTEHLGKVSQSFVRAHNVNKLPLNWPQGALTNRLRTARRLLVQLAALALAQLEDMERPNWSIPKDAP